MKSSEDKIREKIISKVLDLDIPDFLLLEIKKILSLLNYYKLSNLYSNIDDFCDFLLKLNREYVLEVDNLIINKLIDEK